MEQMKEQRLASAGTFCPKKECQLYAKVDEGNLIKFGKRASRASSVTDAKAVKPPLAPRTEPSFIANTFR
jgi:hypothetical protein